MGDTEKEADPVGGSGDSEDGERRGGKVMLGCGHIKMFQTVKDKDRHKDTANNT